MTSKTNKDNPHLMSYMTLRMLVGLLGSLFPALLILGTFSIGKCNLIQNSISHYYYTVMGDVFVGVLCAIGLFLITYQGYDKKDNITTTLAGVFAFCIAFFSTSANEDIICTIRQIDPDNFRTTIHYISAGLFFVITAYISFFLFTKSSGKKTKEKITRNRIYRTCAVLIIAFILMIFILHKTPGIYQRLEDLRPVFWLEWLALLSFGTSWLIKGELLLEDK